MSKSKKHNKSYFDDDEYEDYEYKEKSIPIRFDKKSKILDEYNKPDVYPRKTKDKWSK